MCTVGNLLISGAFQIAVVSESKKPQNPNFGGTFHLTLWEPVCVTVWFLSSNICVEVYAIAIAFTICTHSQPSHTLVNDEII